MIFRIINQTEDQAIICYLVMPDGLVMQGLMDIKPAL